ncbi:MAG TPA: hypothetical protein VNP73_11930 [Actinomycetota bacterium]|nr:hypothetical protein [Actinomycetota bacterium]
MDHRLQLLVGDGFVVQARPESLDQSGLDSIANLPETIAVLRTGQAFY